MQKKLKEINQFANTAATLIRLHQSKIDEKENITKQEERLNKALNKSLLSVKQILEEKDDKISDKKIDLCLEDKDGSVLRDENGNLKLGKEGLKEIEKYHKELLDEVHEVKPNFVEIPEGFPYLTAVILEGFVFKKVE